MAWTESLWIELDEAVDAFEDAYARQGRADIRCYLPHRDHPSYRAVLRELIRVDLEHSWVRGRPKHLAVYLAVFPELLCDQVSLQEIAFEEHRVGTRIGSHEEPENVPPEAEGHT